MTPSWQSIIADVALRIRQALELTAILQMTVDEVQLWLGCDRALIYRFAPDWSGQVIAEAVSAEQWRILDRVVRDPCFEASWLEPYQAKRYYAIENVTTADLTQCHADFLASFQVQANLVIPILVKEQLWGLLVAHECESSCSWAMDTIEGLQQLAVQVGIAIYQAELIAQLQTAKTDLEAQVAARTQELEAANIALEEANQTLIQANQTLVQKILDRNRDKAEVIQREAFLRQVLDTLFAFVGVLTPDGILIEANQAPLAAAGLSRAEVIGKPFADAYWWAYAPEASAAIRQAVEDARQGKTVRFEIPVQVLDGAQIIIDFSLSPLYDHMGNLTHLIPSGVDISDRKQTEAALRQSEATKQALIEAIPDFLVRMRQDGVQLEVFNTGNVACLQPTIRPKEIENSVLYFMPPAVAQERVQLAQRAIATGEMQWHEYVLVNDGQTYYEEARIVPLNDDEVLVMVRDMSDRKQAEAALRQSESTNRALIEAIPDFLVRMRQDGVQLDVINTGNVHCLGPAEGAIEGSNVLDIMPLPIAHERIQLAQQAIATGKSQKQEFSFVEDDQTYYEEARIVPLSASEVLVMVRDISHRKQAEIRLRQREQEYRLLVDNLPAGVVVHGLDTSILANNTRASELLGLTTEQMRGKTAIDPAWTFLKEDGITPMSPTDYPVNRVLASGQPIDNELVGIRRPDRSTLVWVLVNAYPLFQDAQTLERIIVTFVDITAQKQAQFDLIASEQRYVALAATAPVGIFRSDRAGNNIFSNQGLCQIAGLTAAELSGQGWLQAIHPDDVEAVVTAWQWANEQAQTFKHEHRFLHADGRVVWVVVRADVERDARGQLMGYVGVLTDISDRKRAELELRSLKEQLELVIQASSEGFWDWNFTTNEIYFSPSWKKMLGYADDELDNTLAMWESVIFAEDRIAALALIENYNSGKVDNFTAVQRFHHKDGSTVSVLSRAIHLKDDAGNVIRMVGSHLDMTQTLQMQEALKNSEMQLSGILDSSLDGIMAFRTLRDERGQIIDFEWLLSNPTACELVQKPIEELLGKRLLDVMPGNRADGLFDLYVQVVETGIPIQRQFHYSHDGIDTWFENIAVKLGDGFAVTFRDISAVKNSEQALQQANQTLEQHLHDLRQRNEEMQLLSETSDFLQACRSIEEACSVITTLVNPLFPGFAGSFYITSTSRNQLEVVAQWGASPSSQAYFQPHDCWALRRGKWHHAAPEYPGLRCNHVVANEPTLATLCIPMIAQGETLGLFHLSTTDPDLLTVNKEQLARTVAEQVGLAIANLNLRETLQSQSIRDSLTGLFNRRYLEESLQKEIARAARNRSSVAVVMVDVDHFKTFNDTHGHDAGDVVLQAIGQVLKTHIRNSDTACRYGGEEMTLVFPETSLEEAIALADKLRQVIQQLSVSFDGRYLTGLSASFGVAIFPRHGDIVPALIRAADAALYRAKAAGRNQVVAAALGLDATPGPTSRDENAADACH